MAEKVTFTSNGHACEGYLARPETGSGPAVVVIQEWWGLVPHIEDLVERFARVGFLALAPDLYHGKKTTSPDDAGKMLMELDGERARNEISGAGAFLLQQPECSSQKFGVVGFCMGGALAQYTATEDRGVGAAVSFYGGFKKVPVKWEKLEAPILLIYGGEDHGVPASQGEELKKRLEEMGKDVRVKIYPGADHAFFNDTRPEVYHPEAAGDAWHETVEFFRSHLK